MKHLIYRLFTISLCALCAGALTVSCTDSKEKERLEREAKLAAQREADARAEKQAAEMEKLRKADEEAARKEQAELDKGPIQDKHFLSVNMPTGPVNRGDLIEAYVDLAVPFENPFDRSSIHVDAYISGDSNGVSVEKSLFFIGGDSKKSTWKLMYLPRKSGDLKFTFSIRSGNNSYVSLEYPQAVGKSKNSPVYKFSKKSLWAFENGNDESMRVIAANFPLNIDMEKSEKLLRAAKNSGANAIVLRLEAPMWLIVAEDTANQKAGQPNIAAFEKVENIMDEAKKLGLYTILNFSSGKSFEKKNYASTYFAKSGIAPKQKDFFESQEAKSAYINVLNYAVSRFGSRPDLLAWFVFDGIDGVDIDNLDLRTSWLTEISTAVKDADADISHPSILSAKTSSELEFLWGGDICDVLAFDLTDKRDFSNAVDSHSDFFTKRYRKPVAVSSFGLRDLFREESNIFIRNTLWASLFTRTPMLAVADLSDESMRNSTLEAIREVSEFQGKFISGMKSPKVLQLPDKVVQKAAKASEDFIFVQPAFSETYLSRESANDYARLDIDATGTVLKNSMPEILQKGAIVYLNIDGVPNDKCSFNFEVPFLSKDGEIKFEVGAEEREPKTIVCSSKGAKKDFVFNGTEMALVNKTFSIPLEKGDNKFTIQIEGTDNVKAYVCNYRIDGMGSFKGFAGVTVRGISGSGDTKYALWFKRTGMDAYNFGKYKLASRNIGDLKAFDYQLKVGKPNAAYKVVWWNTRAGAELVSGTIKSSADSTLKLRVPPFKTDIACFIEETK